MRADLTVFMPGRIRASKAVDGRNAAACLGCRAAINAPWSADRPPDTTQAVAKIQRYRQHSVPAGIDCPDIAHDPPVAGAADA